MPQDFRATAFAKYHRPSHSGRHDVVLRRAAEPQSRRAAEPQFTQCGVSLSKTLVLQMADDHFWLGPCASCAGGRQLQRSAL
jgi:hypothetical protein